MTKKSVRKAIIQRLRSYSYYNYSKLYHRLFALPYWKQAKVIAITMSTSIEIPTLPVIHQAWQEGKRVVVPKTLPHRRMMFDCYNSNTELQRDRFGILEPAKNQPVKKNQIDIMVVPGLAFTKTGERLGFGGGYYDRYLRAYRGFTVALARSWQVYDQPIWPVTHYDVKVDRVISDKGAFGD